MTAVIGAAMTPFGKHLDTTVRNLATAAAAEALADAGVAPGDVGLVVFGNAAAGVIDGQEMIRAQVALGRTGLAGAAMIDVESACASSSSAFHLAHLAVSSGAYDVAVAIGAEKMTHPDKRRAVAALARAVDVAELVAAHGEGVLVDGAGALFMELYAAEAAAYAAATGASADDFAEVASKSFRHASLNPKAQCREAHSAAAVLASRPIVDPLHLLMCSPIADGAAALVVCSDDYARRRPTRGVHVLASTARSGGGPGDDLVARTAAAAYDAAGLGPADLDVVEVHDAASPAELMVSEQLGIAGPGEGVGLLRAGATRLGGRIPINVSGGLVAKGHPIGATGAAQIVELYDQLAGRCGPRQVHGARVGLAENAGGWFGSGPAACVITILGGPGG